MSILQGRKFSRDSHFKMLLRFSTLFVILLQITRGNAHPRGVVNDTHEISKEEETYYFPISDFSFTFFSPTLTRENCSTDNGDSFPDDIFSDEARLKGALVLHFIGGLYSFTLLAVICNDYFIPAVDCICEDLNISRDVAAATFMAVATSSPELAINMIDTFVTKSDLGIGTIVGSSMFNTLGVGAIGGLAASAPITIKKWPVIRDSIIYCCTVVILVTMTWDNRIDWYESAILVSLYFVYFIFMFNNKKIIGFVKGCFQRKNKNGKLKLSKSFDKSSDIEEEEDRYTARVSIILRRRTMSIKSKLEVENAIAELPDIDVKIRKSLWHYPSEKSILKQVWFIYTWPLKLILTCLIPSPKTWRKLYPLSFIMCIICIGGNSYFVSWMITIIGNTLGIPSSIMGMTFLAFGGCLPEACSIFIMSRRGEGEMGVSNSLGANTLNILFSLGTPWFIKSMVLISDGDDGSIAMKSTGMDYIILSLILATLSLLIVLTIGKFQMKRSVGACIIVIYFVFIIFAILMESGIFFDVDNCI